MKIKYPYSTKSINKLIDKAEKYFIVECRCVGYPYKMWVYTPEQYEELQDCYYGDWLESVRGSQMMKPREIESCGYC